jgi:hypothetical protein
MNDDDLVISYSTYFYHTKPSSTDHPANIMCDSKYAVDRTLMSLVKKEINEDEKAEQIKMLEKRVKEIEEASKGESKNQKNTTVSVSDDNDELSVWLQNIGLERLKTTFEQEEILTLEDVSLLSEADLKEMKIKIGPRNKLLIALKQLGINSVDLLPIAHCVPFVPDEK